MDERKTDFKKIILAWNSGKITPKQLGSLMRQYYIKHLKEENFATFIRTAPQLNPDLSLFDGKVLGDLDS